MAKRETILKQTYNLFNKRYFRGRLPDIPVKWVRHDRGAWMARTGIRIKDHQPVYIQMKSWLMRCPSQAQMTLLHEMVHVEQAHLPKEQTHGRKFQSRMKDLAASGAFKNFW